MKERFFSNVEGYDSKNTIFIDAERKDYIKVYNIISSFLVWTAPKLAGTNITSSFLVCVTPRNVYSRFILFRIMRFTLNSRCINPFVPNAPFLYPLSIFYVVLELRIWIVIWSKKFLNLIGKVRYLDEKLFFKFFYKVS